MSDDFNETMRQTAEITGKVTSVIGKTLFWGALGIATGAFALGIIALGESKQERI